MSRAFQLIAVSFIWSLVAIGAYFIGKSSSTTESTDSSSSTADPANYSNNRYSASGEEASSPRAPAARIAREFRDQGARSTLDRILSINDPLRRGDEFRLLLDRLEAEDFASFIEAFRQDGLHRENPGEYRMALYVWAQKDPLGALAYTRENTRGSWSSQQVLSAWAQYDLVAAETWALANHDGEGANPWLLGVIDGIASVDLNNATRLLNQLPYSRERGEALNSLINSVGKLELDDAIAWLDELGDERLKKGALERLADSLGRRHGAAAAAWAENIKSEETRSRALAEVAEGWIRQDVDSTATWVRSLPTRDQIAMAEDFADDFGRQDFDRAKNWLDSLGSDPALDQARLNLAWSGLRGGNRDQAISLIEEIANSDSTQAERAQNALRRINGRNDRERGR